ncbi:MAG: 1,4-alpha-glucan branching protein domain-containing protein [Solirubrobacterales bacterium]
MSRPRGELAIVLHTHMPYVEGFGTWPFGEEWLWRCVAESYLRLEGVLSAAPLTVGVTPVLADQFEAMRGAAGDRMLGFYSDSREYVYDEDMRSMTQVGEPELSDALAPQLADYRRAAARFEEIGRDLNALIASFARDGSAQLLGGPATHPVMPLLATDFGLDLQLRVGAESHARRFGSGAGIWLPECAYDPSLDTALHRNGVDYFCLARTEQLGIDSLDNLTPVQLPGGPVAVPIDWRSIDIVWDEQGMPGAAAYRSSFKRSIHSLMAWNNEGVAWDLAAARAQADRHADEFLAAVGDRLDAYRADRGESGLCTFAIDTELLGHWWYEGPWWLEAVCARAAGTGIELVTLETALSRRQPPAATPARSSWGADKDLSTWDSPPVADYAWQQRAAELELHDLLGHDAGIAESPAALRAARELLAMQASDWAFIAKRETAGDYAADRFAGHLAAFQRAVAALRQSADRGGHGPDAEIYGLSPGLTNELLAELRCAH